MQLSELERLKQRLEELILRMEQLHLDDYLRYAQNWRKQLLMHFLGGMIRGIGFSIGFTVLGGAAAVCTSQYGAGQSACNRTLLSGNCAHR